MDPNLFGRREKSPTRPACRGGDTEPANATRGVWAWRWEGTAMMFGGQSLRVVDDRAC